MEAPVSFFLFMLPVCFHEHSCVFGVSLQVGRTPRARLFASSSGGGACGGSLLLMCLFASFCSVEVSLCLV